jgi:hypothetical protein
VRELDGDWQVKRTGGLLPPMLGVWKHIRGDRGETRLGPLPGIPLPRRAARGRCRVNLPPTILNVH